MFDEQEFVLVCRRKDYENEHGIIDLLLTAVENNVVKLYPAPNNAVVIFQTLPYSRKVDYIEVD